MTMESSAAAEVSTDTRPDSAGIDPTNLRAAPEQTGQQPRDKGKFAPRQTRANQANLGAIARNEIRKLANPNAKDEEALADVKPKGQKNEQTKDPAPQSAKATDADEAEKTSPAATHAAKHLADARKAVELTGLFSAEEIAAMSPESLLAKGKKAKADQVEVSRKLEEAAKTKAATPSDAPKTDPASPKAVTTDKAATKDASDDPIDALYKEHFGGYEENNDFAKSLGGFSKALHAELSKQMQDAMTTARTELATQIRGEIQAETEYERAVESLAPDFPESSSVDGRSAMRDMFISLAEKKLVKDVKSGVLASANALWAEQRRAREAAATKEKASRDARKNGQPVTGSQGAKPNTAAPNVRTIALGEVRKAMEEAR